MPKEQKTFFTPVSFAFFALLVAMKHAAGCDHASILGKRTASTAFPRPYQRNKKKQGMPILKRGRQDQMVLAQKEKLRAVARQQIKQLLKSNKDKGCPKCDQSVKPRAVIDHYLAAHGDPFYTCASCNKSLNWNNLNRHLCSAAPQAIPIITATHDLMIAPAAIPLAPLAIMSPLVPPLDPKLNLSHLIQHNQIMQWALEQFHYQAKLSITPAESQETKQEKPILKDGSEKAHFKF